VDRQAGSLIRGIAGLAMLVALALLHAPGAAAAAEHYAEVHRRMVAAWQQDDMPAFAAAVGQALELRPDYPQMLYNLALAEARLSRPQAALEMLERLAAMGLAFAADAEAFPSLTEDPRFQLIAARFEANALPAGEAEVYLLADDETGFLPEGIAIDPASGTLFLGSVRRGVILQFHPEHGRSIFAGADPARLWGVMGMAVDGELLWVATSAVEEAITAPPDAHGRAAINGYRLSDGALVVHCPSPGPAVFGDLLPANDGVWVSDSMGRVLHLDPQGCHYVELVSRGLLVSPQGMAPAGPHHLFVADYRGGIFRIRKSDGHSERLTTPPQVTTYGIDGLYRWGEWLVGVQNGLSPHRVIAFRISHDGKRIRAARVLASALPQFDEPTLGVVAGDHLLLVANAAWQRYGAAGGSTPPPLVLAVPLPVEH
jgi:hypothetical protein